MLTVPFYLPLFSTNAFAPSGENSNLNFHIPLPANFHCRAAPSAKFAKYSLGPCESTVASVTSPDAPAVTLIPTLTVPRIVPSDFSDASGIT